MKRFALIAVAASVMFTPIFATDAHALGGSFGIGLHYLRSLGDFEDEDLDLGLKNDNFGIIGSYQHNFGLLTAEGNLEYVFDYVGSDHDLFEPSAYLLIGGLIYGGAGIGVGHLDDRWLDPFYALRLGVNIGLGGLGLDVYTTYKFQNDDDLEDLTGDDLDALTFAGVLRFGGGS